MVYRTREQWKAKGREVRKGQRPIGKLNDNTPLFGKDQTKKFTPTSPHVEDVDDWDGWDREYEQEMGLDADLLGQW